MIVFAFHLLLMCRTAKGRTRAAIMLQARRHVLEAQGIPSRLGTEVHKVLNRDGKEPVHYRISSAVSKTGTATLDPLGEFTVFYDGQAIGVIRSYLDDVDHWAPPTFRSSWLCAAA